MKHSGQGKTGVTYVENNASLNDWHPLLLFGCGGREDWPARGHIYEDLKMKLMGRLMGYEVSG